jgi:hypothetical protein
MAFINWGEESREQKELRNYWEQQALYEQAIKLRLQAQGGVGGSSGGALPKTESVVCVIDANFDFWRVDYSTGEKVQLTDANERPAIEVIQLLATDVSRGVIWLVNQARRGSNAALYKVTVTGDELFWEVAFTGLSRFLGSGAAFDRENDLLLYLQPVSESTSPEFYLKGLSTRTGESSTITSFGYDEPLSSPILLSNSRAGWITLVFRNNNLFEVPGEPTEYFVFEVEVSALDGAVFTAEQEASVLLPRIGLGRAVTLDSANGRIVYYTLPDRLDPPTTVLFAASLQGTLDFEVESGVEDIYAVTDL